MIIKKVLQNILNHPLNKGKKLNALLRFLKWQINTKINPYPIIYSYAEKSKFIVKKGLTGATGNLYCGLHEFEDMAFVLHFLSENDLFVDVGANVGSYTLLAASEKGAQTIAIEPVPQTYNFLFLNVQLNNLQDRVLCLNIGLGSDKGQLRFTNSLDTTNHVALESETDVINVKVDYFDNLIQLDKNTLIKIDVEGFETEVIKGMQIALKSKFLKAIIIELNGAGKRYNYDDSEIHQTLLSNKFLPYKYNPFDRELNQIKKYGTHNTLYIKDIDHVLRRVKKARKVTINKISF